MRITLLLLTVSLAVAAAAPNFGRIIGGSNAVISAYPFSASLIYSRTGSGRFSFSCGGAIIKNRVILTAAYCLYNEPVNRWRIRIGSAKSNSGGVVHNAARSIVHPYYNSRTADSDIAILHSATNFVFNNNARAGGIASVNYNLPDNSPVIAIGWGRLSYNGKLSDTLRRVDIWSINRNICKSRYSEQGYLITENMLCAGWLDIGSRGQCIGDSGSPLIHGKTIVGVYSWSHQCGLPRYPGVNTFVPRFTTWILANS